MDTNDTNFEFGSLFSGVGGLDLGLEQAGLKCRFQVENDRHCLTILARHWPDVPKNEIRPCMGLVGGDPCPIRSKASRIAKTRSPDMSGYFLAMVARIKPRWVLRENVPAPDVMDFHAAITMLGYRGVIVTMDSAAFTGQSRLCEFLVAFDNQATLQEFMVLVERDVNSGITKKDNKDEEKAACLGTSSRRRLSHAEDYVFEGSKWGLRVFTHTERESLQGFPAGWTDGIPNTARERAVGNAVTVPVAKWLGERIIEALINNNS